MGKISKKGIMKIALLTSLSVFAGVAIASNTLSSTSGSNKSGTQNQALDQNGHRQLDANGCPVSGRKNKGNRGLNPDGTQKEFKKVDPARLEELKKKLNTGRVTKEEAAEIIELIDRKAKRSLGTNQKRTLPPAGTSSNTVPKGSTLN